jgi:hypothetical protein
MKKRDSITTILWRLSLFLGGVAILHTFSLFVKFFLHKAGLASEGLNLPVDMEIVYRLYSIAGFSFLATILWVSFKNRSEKQGGR